MKGFVPVTKDSLLEMVANSLQEINKQEASETIEQLDVYISKEKERMNIRRWYRLWQLPAARFAFDEVSVKAYSAGRTYDLFEGCPFKHIKSDAKNSRRWLKDLKLLADSEYSGEPIQLDLKTFMRISEPERYYWVNATGHYYTVR